MSVLLEAYLRSVSAAHITEFFFIFIGVLFVFGILVRRGPRWQSFDMAMPGLLTSLGILGTFAGIVVGLLAFDPKHIDASIEHLLTGLKTAFMTSLAGISAAILYRMTSALEKAMFSAQAAQEGVTIDDLFRVNSQNGDRLEAIKKAIAGDEESSLVGQFKLFKSDLRDYQSGITNRIDALAQQSIQSRELLANINSGMDTRDRTFDEFKNQLWEQLKQFAEMMSKSATEQVIEALKNVIQDFNKNLTEQFGENFKALDASVQKLVEWQDKYREQLAQMIDQYTQGVAAIDSTKESVASIEGHSAKIPESMAKLEAILTVNQHQISQLTEHLKAFRDMRDEAVKAVPEIRQQVEATVADITDAAKKSAEYQNDTAQQIHKSLEAGAEEFKNSVNQVNASLQSTSDVVGTDAQKITQILDDATKDTQEKLRNMVDHLAEESTKITDAITEASQATISETTKVRDNVASAIEQMSARIEASTNEVFQAQKNQMEHALAAASDAMKAAVDQTGERVNAQVGVLDEALQRELNRTLDQLGQHLTQITRKFTTDYQQLVQQMDEVIRSQSDAA